MHKSTSGIDIMGLNSGRSDLNCNTRVLEFFFVLVDFLQTTSGNPDHKHCNLGWSDLNCISKPIKLTLCDTI